MEDASHETLWVSEEHNINVKRAEQSDFGSYHPYTYNDRCRGAMVHIQLLLLSLQCYLVRSIVIGTFLSFCYVVALLVAFASWLV